jgi:hypothetical protein
MDLTASKRAALTERKPTIPNDADSSSIISKHHASIKESEMSESGTHEDSVTDELAVTAQTSNQLPPWRPPPLKMPGKTP